MRCPTLIPLLLVSLAGTALAQGQPQIPSPFGEDGKKLGPMMQELGELFDEDDYEGALVILKDQMGIVERAIERVKKGEVDMGEHKETMLRWLTQGGHPQIPSLSVIHYNEACCLSMMGKKEEAIAELGKSMELGYLDLTHMKIDTDLDPIRKEPGYKELMVKLNYNDVFEVYKPEGLPPAAPLIVFLHRDRRNEKKALEDWKALADRMKAVLVVPRAPILQAKDSYLWKRTSNAEESGIKKVKATVEAAKAQYSVDAGKVWLVGYGQGGYFASLTALMNPTLVRGVVPINAYWNKYFFEDFLEKAKEAGLAFCFLHGKKNASFGRAEAGVKQLTEAGVKAEFIPFEGDRTLPEGSEVDLVEKALKTF